MVDGPDGNLGLDLKPLGHDGHGLHERTREGAVAGEHILERMPVQDADEPAHQGIAKAMKATPVFRLVRSVGDAVTHGHVRLAGGNGRE